MWLFGLWDPSGILPRVPFQTMFKGVTGWVCALTSLRITLLLPPRKCLRTTTFAKSRRKLR